MLALCICRHIHSHILKEVSACLSKSDLGPGIDVGPKLLTFEWGREQAAMKAVSGFIASLTPTVPLHPICVLCPTDMSTSTSMALSSLDHVKTCHSVASRSLLVSHSGLCLVHQSTVPRLEQVLAR